jgi:hypothetical protein
VANDLLSREDLRGVTDQYLDALSGHAPNRLPLSGHVKYTENGQPLEPGDGIWGTNEGVGKYRIDILDQRGQQAGYIGTVKEVGQWIWNATRLRVEGGAITEIESLIVHPPAMGDSGGFNGAAQREEVGRAHEAFYESLAREDRRSRKELIAAANSYFSGLERNTGHYPVHFTPDCERRENGTQTTSNPELADMMAGRPSDGRQAGAPDIVRLGPDAQLKSGFFNFVTAIRNRRFPVVDEETGNVMAFGFFDHTGRTGDMKLADGSVVASPLRMPLTWQIVELFKVKGGLLRQIEAVLTQVPYCMKCRIWDD